MLNNLIKKLDKTGSTKRTLASSHLHPLRIREKNQGCFLFKKSINQWLGDCFWSLWLREDIVNMVCTKTSFYYLCLCSTSNIMQLCLVPADDILHRFVCLHFSLDSLSKLSKFAVFIFSQKSCFVMSLECLYSKIR